MASRRPTARKYGRRTFLAGLGLGVGAAGAAGVAAGVGLGRTELRLSQIVPGNFSRMFPDLPPFFDGLRTPGATDQLRDVMRDVGKPGGLLDAKDALGAGPVALIADATVNGNDPPTNPDNPTHTAGTTFFGQFMDLDITFDSRSTLGVPTDPTTTLNGRAATFDLDTIYGQGPFVTPQFYEVEDQAKLRIESGGIFEDLPRNAEGTAIVPDPRSDQQIMIAGLNGEFTSRTGKYPNDLRSASRAARRSVGWQTFFDFKDGEVKRNKRMDTKISTPLFTLPLAAIASHKAPIALMQRNLLRHITWSMPSGQSIARAIGGDRLSAADLKELRAYDMGLEANTPLFYYMLREAELVPDTDIGKNTGGFHLGPVAGRIVGEVVIGLLQSDPASWLRTQPDWLP